MNNSGQNSSSPWVTRKKLQKYSKHLLYAAGFNPGPAFFLFCKGRNDVATKDCRWYESVVPLKHSCLSVSPGLLQLFSTSGCGILVVSSPVLCTEVTPSSSVFNLPASPAVLSVHIVGVGPQIPASSWSIGMACVTPASLTWHLGHEDSFRWTHPDPSLCAAALSVSFPFTPLVIRYPTDFFSNDVMEVFLDRW